MTTKALIVWIIAFLGYARIPPEPHIRMVLPHQLQALCGTEAMACYDYQGGSRVIYLPAGKDRNETTLLLVHELVHVVQHHNGRFSADKPHHLLPSNQRACLEYEAHRVAVTYTAKQGHKPNGQDILWLILTKRQCLAREGVVE